MSDPNQRDETQEANAAEPREVGFLEKRWRLAKTAVKSVAGYLTNPKTYLYAAAFGAGFAALPALTGGALSLGVSLPTFGSAAYWPALGSYVAQMVTLGTLFHVGTDMIKEGRSCKNENDTACADQPRGQTAEPDVVANEAQQGHGYDSLSNDLIKPMNTPAVANLDQTHNQHHSIS